MRGGRHVHAAQPEAVDAVDFGDCSPNVPERNRRHRQQSIVGLALHLCHGIVVDGGDRPAKPVVGDLRHRRARKAERVRIDDLGPDAEFVHHRQAGRRRVRTRVDVIESPREELDAFGLRSVSGDDTGRTGTADVHAVIDDPSVLPVVLGNSWEPTLQRWCAARSPEIVRFGVVGVGVDDRHPVEHRWYGHGYPLIMATRAFAHRCSPTSCTTGGRCGNNHSP